MTPKLPTVCPFSSFFFVKPGPLQRCVSMLQTESLRKQTFIFAYEKFGEIASLSARPSHLVCGGVDALPVTASRDLAPVIGIRKAGPGLDLALRVFTSQVPLGGPLRSL